MPEEKSENVESTKKRPRTKSVSKSNVGTTKKKKEEDQIPEKKMEVEEENEDKKNKNQTGYGYIINNDETFAKYNFTVPLFGPFLGTLLGPLLFLLRLLELEKNNKQHTQTAPQQTINLSQSFFPYLGHNHNSQSLFFIII